MTVIIELTLEQIRDLDGERHKLGAMEEAKSPGMMIAQVFVDHMKVGVINHEKALAVQRALGAKNDGKTVRTAYDLPANVDFSGSTPLYGGESAGKKGSTS